MGASRVQENLRLRPCMCSRLNKKLGGALGNGRITGTRKFTDHEAATVTHCTVDIIKSSTCGVNESSGDGEYIVRRRLYVDVDVTTTARVYCSTNERMCVDHILLTYQFRLVPVLHLMAKGTWLIIYSWTVGQV